MTKEQLKGIKELLEYVYSKGEENTDIGEIEDIDTDTEQGVIDYAYKVMIEISNNNK